MKRVTLLFLSLVAIISMQSLSAQNFSVKGKVISEEGNEPLIGGSKLRKECNLLEMSIG